MKKSRSAASQPQPPLPSWSPASRPAPRRRRRPKASETQSGVKAGEATSAADFGGMDALVEAAKKEGELNVIALPPDWANYGAIIKAFADKYGIKVNSAQPDAASQDEINAANQQKGKSTAPDVFDLGQSRGAGQHGDVRAVQGRDVRRHPRRRSRTPTAPGSTTTAATCRSATTRPRCRRSPSVNDLLKPEYKGKVALNGDPTQAGAAFSGVLMVALSPGRLGRRHRAGRRVLPQAQGGGQLPARRPDPGHHRVRPDAGRHRLELPQRRRDREAAELAGRRPAERRGRRLLLPGDQQGRPASRGRAAVAGVPLQRRGPEPLRRGRGPAGARRRRWCRPAPSTRRRTDKLPVIDGPVTVPTPDQTEKATKYLADNWAKAIG